MGTGRHGKRFLVDPAKNYKAWIKRYTKVQDDEFHDGSKFTLGPNEFISLSMYVFMSHESFYLKDGVTLRKIDASGFTKAFEDGLSEYVGIDDSQNLDVLTCKRPNPVLADTSFIVAVLQSTKLVDLPIATTSDLRYIIERIRSLQATGLWNI